MSDNPAANSEMWTQLSAFPDLVPDVHGEAAVRPQETSTANLVLRTPGWRLIASKGAVHGFHRVKSVGAYNTVRTACGLVGRAIAENEQFIVECPTCQAGAPT